MTNVIRIKIRKLFYGCILAMMPLPSYAKKGTDVSDKIAKESLQFVGAPYQYGGKGPSRFDCSGFTRYVYAMFGIDLPNSSPAQYNTCKKVKERDVKCGDLIFFNGSKIKKGDVGHVGIVCEIKEDQKGVRFIHATVSKGVIIDDYPGYDYYNQRFVGIGRVNQCSGTPETDREEKPRRKKSEESITIEKDKEIEEMQPLPQPDKKKVLIKKSGKRHRVLAGETVYRISRLYGCDILELIKINHITNNQIYVGQELEIPEQ